MEPWTIPLTAAWTCGGTRVPYLKHLIHLIRPGQNAFD
jgi:hypothetical protein